MRCGAIVVFVGVGVVAVGDVGVVHVLCVVVVVVVGVGDVAVVHVLWWWLLLLVFGFGFRGDSLLWA